MYFSYLVTMGLATVAFAAPPTVDVDARQEATNCQASNDEALNSYDISATIPAADAPSICGGLWDNLKAFPCAPSQPNCGSNEAGEFTWYFKTQRGCNAGMVEATWWEATKNTFGPVFCI